MQHRPLCQRGQGLHRPKAAFAGAFQWDDRANVTNPCKRLTGTAAQGADLTANTYYGYSAYLIDEEDAAKGIMLHRGGGTDCGGEGERKLNITLECGTNPDEQSQEPSDEEYVFEDKTCTYEIIMKTSYGCPDQCKSPADVLGENEAGFQTATEVCNNKKDGGASGTCRTLNSGVPECACAETSAAADSAFVGPGCTFACPGENSRLGLCSKRGHCAYDADVSSTGKAVCFCDSGFMGETCQRTDPTLGRDTLTLLSPRHRPCPGS